MAQLRSTPTGSGPALRVRTGRRRSFAALAAGALLATLATTTPSLLSGSGASAATVVQGKTWYDLNRNGVQDTNTNAQTNETAIAGVPVLVTAVGGQTEATTSGTDGTWTVTMSADGPYRVEFGQFPQPCPAIALPCVVTGRSVGGTTVQFPGTGQATVNLGVFAKFNGLGSLEALTENAAVEIGDRVWADTNANGIQDPGEPGIPGVTVKIDGQFGNTGFDAKITDTNGNYLFTGLQSNLTYRVTIDSTQPTLAGYTLTTGGQGNRAIDSNPTALDTNGLAIADVPLRKAAENDHTFDFGWVPPVRTGGLGDRVWLDTNTDGIQDDGEPGIEGAIVKLLDTDGNPVAEQTTNQNGLYLFADLNPAAHYIIECQAPPQLEGIVVRSPANQASNDETDSDADPTTGRTGLNTIPTGTNNLSADCGWFVHTPPTTEPPSTLPPPTEPPSTTPPSTTPPSTTPPTTTPQTIPPQTIPPTTAAPTTTTPPTTTPPTTAPPTTTPPTVMNTVMTAPPPTLPPLPPLPPETPTYTGSESTQRALLALSMLLVGIGLLGLTRHRRPTAK